MVRQSLKDTPVELPTAKEAIETDQEYYDMQEAQAQAEQTVDYWLKKANYLNIVSLVFALVMMKQHMQKQLLHQREMYITVSHNRDFAELQMSWQD